MVQYYSLFAATAGVAVGAVIGLWLGVYLLRAARKPKFRKHKKRRKKKVVTDQPEMGGEDIIAVTGGENGSISSRK